jgi:hypothetical protein
MFCFAAQLFISEPECSVGKFAGREELAPEHLEFFSSPLIPERLYRIQPFIKTILWIRQL